MSTIQLNLTLSEGGSFATSATVVRLFEDAFAVSIDANPREILLSLTARLEAPHEEEETAGGKPPSVWDRVRAMTYAEKMILASKADRSERAVLYRTTIRRFWHFGVRAGLPLQPGRSVGRPGYRWLLAFRGYAHRNTFRYRVKHG